MILDVLKRVFERGLPDLDLVAVSSGAKAVALMQSRVFVAIATYYAMPAVDGREALFETAIHPLSSSSRG